MRGERWRRVERLLRQIKGLIQAVAAFVFVGTLGDMLGRGQQGRAIWLMLDLLVLERRDLKPAELSKGGELF